MRIKLLFLFLLLFVVNANSQYTTNSPYSSYGLGEYGGMEHANFTGIGNTTITYFDSTTLNFYNPSSYNTLAEGQPLFSFGIASRISFFEQNGTSQIKSSAFLEHFVMAFKVKKHFGLAVGMKPFARKGYSMNERVFVGGDSIEYNYNGFGGTNQVFLGLSSNLIKYKNSTLSVGTNLSYLFGTSTNERTSNLYDPDDESVYGGIEWSSLKVNSFYYDLGINYRQIIKNDHQLTLTAVIQPGQSLNATKDEYLFYGQINDPEQYDTLGSTTGVKGKINLPATSAFGLNYSFWFNDVKKNNTARNSELSFHSSFTTTDWSRFSSSFSTSNLLPSTKLTVGLQYSPERKILDNATSASFFELVRYRAGYYYSSLPYSYNGVQLKDFGATLGFGIPILVQKSLSSINFGFSFGKRETGTENAFNERYIGINFGLTLSPGNFERWFRKSKVD